MTVIRMAANGTSERAGARRIDEDDEWTEPRYRGPERRSGAPPSDGAFAGLPLWARVIAMVGIPGAIAFFLVYTGAQILPAIQTEMTALRLEAEKSRAVYENSLIVVQENRRLLQRICSRVSKTDEERTQCFDR